MIGANGQILRLFSLECERLSIQQCSRLQVQQQKSIYAGSFDALGKISRREGIRGLYKGFLPHNIGLLGLQTHSTAYELSRHLLLPTTWSPTWKGLVAGTIASSSSQIVNVPVDVVSQKLMMAGQSKNLNISLRNVIVEIYSKNGLRGFYKGYFISLLTFGPTSGIWWSTYLTVHDYLLPNFPTALNAFSRMCAGFTSSTLTNPLDVIRTLRTRFQVIGGKSIGNIARRLYKEKGLAMLYKGLTARYMSTLPSSALYIAMYELVKNLQAYVYSK